MTYHFKLVIMESTNWLALVAAAVSTFVVGSIWYNPKVFGNAWMQSVGMTEEKAKEGNMAMIFGIGLIMAFIAAFFIGHLVDHGGEEFQTFKHGALHGSMLGVLISMPIVVTNALYEQKSFKYMLINMGYWIVCFTVMGGILAAWH